MRMNLPRAAQYAMRVLRNAGHQAYIVGGSVRDVLLGKQPDDYDITTSALPGEVIDLFKRDKLSLNGLKHGTVRLIKYAMPIEITTFCLDRTYEDDDADDMIFTGSLYEDVRRRDFTINAMCWSEEVGLIDYTGGEEDIQNRLIRCVAEPNASFQEDPLRMLRALRFSAALDFDIDPPAARAIHSNRALLSELPGERVLMELKKLLCGPRAEALLVEFRDAFAAMMPELDQLDGDQYLLAARRMSLIAPAPELKLAALLLDLPREAAESCAARIKCSKLTRKFLDGAFEHAREPLPIDRVGMRHALNAYGDELLAGLVELRAAHLRALTHMIIQQDDCVTLKQLALTAEDVFRLGVTRRNAPACLHGLLERVMNGELSNTREALSAAVRQEVEAKLAEKSLSAPKKPRRRRKSAPAPEG